MTAVRVDPWARVGAFVISFLPCGPVVNVISSSRPCYLDVVMI